MQNYTITTRPAIKFTESDGIIVKSTIDFLVGMSFAVIRDHAKYRGYLTIPEYDARPLLIEFKDVVYRFYGDESKIYRITKTTSLGEEVDISWNELPDKVKGLI